MRALGLGLVKRDMGALTLGLAKRDRGSLRLGLAKKRHRSPETMSKRKRSLLQINTYHLTPSQRRVHVTGKDIATTTCYNNSCQRNVAGPYNGQKKNAKSFRVHFLATSSSNSNRKYSNKANTTTAKVTTATISSRNAINNGTDNYVSI